jgi:serine/threonine protein phosphatase PrpC
MTGSEDARPGLTMGTEHGQDPAEVPNTVPLTTEWAKTEPPQYRPTPYDGSPDVLAEELTAEEGVQTAFGSVQSARAEMDSGWLDGSEDQEPATLQPVAQDVIASELTRAEQVAGEGIEQEDVHAAPPASEDGDSRLDLAWVSDPREAEIGDGGADADPDPVFDPALAPEPDRAESDHSSRRRLFRHRRGDAKPDDVPHEASPPAASSNVSDPSDPFEPPAAAEALDSAEPSWPMHSDGRWVVGDAGNQPRTVVRPTRRPAGAPVDTALDGAVVGNLVYRAASLRGFGHQETGKPRQDAFAIRVTRSENWLVMCVADGVSDGPRSEIAAEVASDTVVRSLVTLLDESEVPAGPAEWEELAGRLQWVRARDTANRELVRRARTDVDKIYRAREATARNIHPKHVKVPEELLPQSHADVRALMATTAVCLVVATRPDPKGRYWYAVGVVAGDSASYLLHNRAWRQILSPKDVSGEVASNDVQALPTSVAPSIRLGCLRAGDALALFSDGVSDPLGSGRGTLGRFLAGQWHTPPDLFDFGKHVGFYSKGWFDDRTAAVAWAPEPNR